MFIDRPEPGTAYVVFLALTVLGLLAVPLILWNIKPMRPAVLIPVGVVSVAGAVVLALFLMAGFDTEYVIDDQHIRIRNGLIQKTTVELETIESVEKEPLIRQPIGFTFKWKGYCNRWTNGISIRTAKRVIFLSPADVDRFIEEIEKRRGLSPFL